MEVLDSSSGHKSWVTETNNALNVNVVTGGGGGSGTSIEDLLFTDDSGATFIYRDNGAVPPVFTAYTVASGTLSTYTPSTNPKPYAVAKVTVTSSALPTGASTDANLTTLLGTANTNLVQLHTDLGTDATGVVPLTGAAGERGWTSGIFKRLSAVTGLNAVLGTASTAFQIDSSSAGTVGIQIVAAGGASGFVLTPQISQDGGTTWLNVGVLTEGFGSTSSPSSTITAAGYFKLSGAGRGLFRLFTTTGSGTGGTVTGYITAGTASEITRSAGVGDQADIAATTDTGNASLVSLIKRLLSNGTQAKKTGVDVTGTVTTGSTTLITAGTFTGIVNFQNKSATETIYVTFTTTATSANFGVGPGGVLTLQFGPTNNLQGIATASATFAAIGA